MREVFEADLTWNGEAFVAGLRVAANDGVIATVDTDGPVTQRLRGKALLPGFINAHSHAFQRGLRGRGELFRAGTGSFWSWREAMYGLVESMSREQLLELTTTAYREMLRAGITTVGEFHYLHHSEKALDAEQRDFALDEVIVEAANAAGIRLVLLLTYYASAGFGRELERPQRRFATRSLDEYWSAFDRIQARLGARHRLGVVAHSVRAASPDEIVALHEGALARGVVMHMHVEEQQKEIDDCVAAYGARPMELLLQRLGDLHNFTAVHCTHTRDRDLDEFTSRGGTVCITPLTEANLGDGIPDVTTLRSRIDHVALGSDSNARISMLEEMRWLEYAQRLRSETRGVFIDADGRLGANLLRTATTGGARSLGVTAGTLLSGSAADFCLIDLDVPTLRHVETENLAEALIFGTAEEAVAGAVVGGEFVWGKQ